MLPAEDKRVLRVDTLVLTNGCAGRSATIDLPELLSDRFPDFLRHNRETANATGLELAGVSKRFFERGGPELADEFVPWLVDLMPPANWAYFASVGWLPKRAASSSGLAKCCTPRRSGCLGGIAPGFRIPTSRTATS